MPAPNRRNRGASLAEKIGNHTAAKGVAHDGDRMVAARTRQDKRWEEAASALGSTLAERADQARADYERAKQFEHYDTDVRQGRAKPPTVVLTPRAEPRYFFGHCLRCDCEVWHHKPKPRVPICAGCRS